MGRISMPIGKGSISHNRRNYPDDRWPDHIDRSRTEENILLVDKTLNEAYDEIFGEAIAEYNAKQIRPDRRIDDYQQKLLHSKNGEKLMYEYVLQWGKKEDFEKNPKLRDVAKAALEKYVADFPDRNPHIKIVGAYIHMDEQSPHLHLDVIPVADGYKKGLKLRNSLDRALQQQGCSPEKKKTAEGKDVRKTALEVWKDRERAYFAGVCQEKGLEVEPERQWGRGNLSVAEYKEAREKMIAPLEQERNGITQAIADLRSKAAELKTSEEDKVATVAVAKAVEEALSRPRKFWEDKEKPVSVTLPAAQVELVVARAKKSNSALARAEAAEDARDKAQAAQKKAEGQVSTLKAEKARLEAELKDLRQWKQLFQPAVDFLYTILAEAKDLWRRFVLPVRGELASQGKAVTWYTALDVQPTAEKFLQMDKETSNWEQLENNYFTLTGKDLIETIDEPERSTQRESMREHSRPSRDEER